MQMKLFAENADHYLARHSAEFHSEFMGLINRKKPVRADCNVLYQEHILDSEHMHLNATKWQTLTDYISYLGREGIVKVEPGERHLLITYIDRGTELDKLKKEKLQKKAIIERTEEERDRKELQDQIQRALVTKVEEKPMVFKIKIGNT